MKLSTVKKTVMATAMAVATAVAVVGMPSTASALFFPEGDLGFYVYGGSNERYENFGTGSSALLGGTNAINRDIASSLTTLQEGANLGLRYSVIGTSPDAAYMYVSSATPTIDETIRVNTFADVAAGNFLQWANSFLPAVTGGLANPLLNNPTILSRALINSFTSQLGSTGLLGGNLGFTTHGVLGQSLTIFRINIDGAAPEFERMGTALLTANGQFTITPAVVPVPAAVVLFGTGLAALVGIARRSINKNKMAA